jgi:hypothetical protein
MVTALTVLLMLAPTTTSEMDVDIAIAIAVAKAKSRQVRPDAPPVAPVVLDYKAARQKAIEETKPLIVFVGVKGGVFRNTVTLEVTSLPGFNTGDIVVAMPHRGELWHRLTLDATMRANLEKEVTLLVDNPQPVAPIRRTANAAVNVVRNTLSTVAEACLT